MISNEIGGGVIEEGLEPSGDLRVIHDPGITFSERRRDPDGPGLMILNAPHVVFKLVTGLAPLLRDSRSR